MKLKAYAKINLSLNVLGVKDGYHDLESVVAQISLCDEITIRKSKDISVSYGSSFSISPEQDNAYKACKLFMEEFGTGGAEIKITKKIPSKAGLGGSSADSVGVIRGMQALYGIEDENRIQKILARAGSDCPVQYAGGYSLMRGRGETVDKINSHKKLYAVILTEPKGVNTAECFAVCDKSEPEKSNTEELIRYLTAGKRGEMPELKNALYLPSTELNERVKDNLELLKGYFDRVNMSGSGSAVYGITENRRSAKRAYKKLVELGYKVFFVKVG